MPSPLADCGQVGVGQTLGDAEVDDVGVAAGVDQDVLRFDVAVDVTALVGVVEGGAELLEEGGDVVRVEGGLVRR